VHWNRNPRSRIVVRKGCFKLAAISGVIDNGVGSEEEGEAAVVVENSREGKEGCWRGVEDECKNEARSRGDVEDLRNFGWTVKAGKPRGEERRSGLKAWHVKDDIAEQSAISRRRKSVKEYLIQGENFRDEGEKESCRLDRKGKGESTEVFFQLINFARYTCRLLMMMMLRSTSFR
jgi:hypothetical protein